MNEALKLTTLNSTISAQHNKNKRKEFLAGSQQGEHSLVTGFNSFAPRVNRKANKNFQLDTTSYFIHLAHASNEGDPTP